MLIRKSIVAFATAIFLTVGLSSCAVAGLGDNNSPTVENTSNQVQSSSDTPAEETPREEPVGTPTLSLVEESTSFTTKIGSFDYFYDRPVLTGVAASIKEQIETSSDKFFKKAPGQQKKKISACVARDGETKVKDLLPDETREIQGSVTGMIYESRYLSVKLSWTAYCIEDWQIPTDKFLNIDLTTGKSVKLSSFVSNKGNTFNKALDKELKTEGGTWPAVLPTKWGGWDGWIVSDEGVTITLTHYNRHTDFLIDWEDIKKPA